MAEIDELHVPLCESGFLPDGSPCTGSAHARGVTLQCTDNTHVIKEDDRGVYQLDSGPPYNVGPDYGAFYIKPDKVHDHRCSEECAASEEHMKAMDEDAWRQIHEVEGED